MFTVTVKPEKCKGCAFCVEFCPKKIMALSEEANDQGQYIAYCSQPEACIGCKSCGIICPDDAIVIEKK